MASLELGGLRMMYQGKYLYKWNWVGGGYNQCRADSDRQALMRAREIGKGRRLQGTCRYLSLKRVRNEKSFWDNYPMFD